LGYGIQINGGKIRCNYFRTSVQETLFVAEFLTNMMIG